MSGSKKSRSKSFAAEAAQRLAPFLRGMGFRRKGAHFFRLRNRIWQSVALFSGQRSVESICHLSLGVASLVQRELLPTLYYLTPTVKPPDESNPPPAGDFDFDKSIGVWDWSDDLTNCISEMQSRIALEAPPFFDSLSSESQLLARFRSGSQYAATPLAALLALDRDHAGVERACADLRDACLSLEHNLHEIGKALRRKQTLTDGIRQLGDWRAHVRRIHELLERTDPTYEMNASVLSDDHYKDYAPPAPVVTRAKAIRRLLRLHGDRAMEFEGVLYTRAELEGMIQEN